jgi:hypothetical protein
MLMVNEERTRRGLTLAATAFRILTFCANTRGFMKHSSSVAIAIVAGIATKLKTLWFLSMRR